MKRMRKVGLLVNRDIPGAEAAVREALHLIREAKAEPRLDSETAAWLGESGSGESVSEAAVGCQAVLVFGGDGTFLRAARELADVRMPLLGINMGSLGFLTFLRLAEISETMPRVLAGNYRVEERMRLKATLERKGEMIDHHLALNDAVVSMSHGSRLIEFNISVGEQYLGDYRADGLIVSTPTGSTAYSLSAGGPIIHPTMDALVATPISPHALSIRPIVVGGEEEIAISIGERSGNSVLTVDGTVINPLQQGDVIHVRQAKRSQPIILPESLSYYGLVREKLGWGGIAQER